MAETTPLPTSEDPGPDVTYRPVSGLAIAGLGLGALFAVVVAAEAISGLISGMPFFLSGWFLLLPVAGVALSWLARRQIRASEGTRAGLGLARAGLWLSVLFGLGYAAYAGATVLAVRSQAVAFLLDPDNGPNAGFFAKLASPRGLNAAFLLTQPPDVRAGVNSADEARMRRFDRTSRGLPGPLTQFRNNPMVRIVRTAGPEADVRVATVRTCTYREGGYWVDLVVDVQTPYETIHCPMTVRSQENPATGREWYVDWTRTPSTFAPETGWVVTERGEQVNRLRLDSLQFAKEWAGLLPLGAANAARRQACTPADFEPGGAGLDVSALPPEFAPKVRRQLEQLFQSHADGVPARLRHQLGFPNELLPTWKKDPKGRVQFVHDFTLILPEPEAKDPQPVNYSGRLILRRKDAGGLTYNPDHPPSWCVVRLELTRAQRASDRRPGGG